MDAIVVIGGAPPAAAVRETLPAGALVVAADSGLDHARALGLVVDVVVGDLDSVSADALAAAERDGVAIERHPPDKDATDTELALRAATTRGADAITLLSGGGDRFDHVLGTLAALAATSGATASVTAWVGETSVAVVRGPGRVDITGRPGAYVSLVAWGGSADGVRTDGLRWRLDGARLDPDSALGISNELTGSRASVALEAGVLLVVQPHALG